MKHVEIEVYSDVQIEVLDFNGEKLNCEVESFGGAVKVNMKPADLSQFTAELLLRHPEMRPEIEQIINEINLKNNLVKP